MSKISCPGCGRDVAELAPACPHCRTKIYVEHPGDIKRVKHAVLTYPEEEQARKERKS